MFGLLFAASVLFFIILIPAIVSKDLKERKRQASGRSSSDLGGDDTTTTTTALLIGCAQVFVLFGISQVASGMLLPAIVTIGVVELIIYFVWQERTTSASSERHAALHLTRGAIPDLDDDGTSDEAAVRRHTQEAFVRPTAEAPPITREQYGAFAVVILTVFAGFFGIIGLITLFFDLPSAIMSLVMTAFSCAPAWWIHKKLDRRTLDILKINRSTRR